MNDALRVSRIHFPVTALGPGPRLGLWVQGCHLACPGCMSRDTWDPYGGDAAAIDDLVAIWRDVRQQGATGLTISGGEPAEQAGQVAELVRRIRDSDAELASAQALPGQQNETGAPEPADVLIFSGLDEDQFLTTCPTLAGYADAAMLGRFDITRPTDLVWRGSANQRLVTFTALGAERYAGYQEATTAAPAMQFLVEEGRIWTIGVPRIGDLPALERSLRAQGIEMGGVSWRP